MRQVVYGIAALMTIAAAGPGAAQETALLHAAGSLRGAMTEISAAFEKAHGAKTVMKFGPSGLLRDAIAAGEKAEVFASANMAHPLSLAKAGKSGPVEMFARNSLCAFARPGVRVESSTLLDVMLDPAIKLGTSTPRADPSGDYAFEVFARAEKLRPGARAALEAKALQLTGGPSSPPPPPGVNVYAKLLQEGAADVFLAYCSGAGAIAHDAPGVVRVDLPAPLAIGADYGLTVVNGASPAARSLAGFILSTQGREILRKHGFDAPTAARKQ